MTFFFNAPIGKPSPYFSYETASQRLGYKNMIVTTLMMFFIALLIWGCAAIVTHGIPDTELVVIIIKAVGKLYFALGTLTFALIAVPAGIMAAPWLRLQCELWGMNFKERSYVTCKPNTKREICLTIETSGLSVTVASIIDKDEHTKYNYSSQKLSLRSIIAKNTWMNEPASLLLIIKGRPDIEYIDTSVEMESSKQSTCQKPRLPHTLYLWVPEEYATAVVEQIDSCYANHTV